MFNSLFNKKPQCPVSDDIRIWLEDLIIWLIEKFGENKLLESKMLTPCKSDFPIDFDGSEHSAHETVKILCTQLEVDSNSIDLHFFKDNIIQIESGLGRNIYTQIENNNSTNAGLFFGKNENGRFTIALEHSLIPKPEEMIYVLSHELSHVKLLGGGVLKENDEYITDLLLVFYGLGIFSANASFKFYSDQFKWGYSSSGYLTQQEWGYALALYSYIRKDKNEPEWAKFLAKNVNSDFKKSRIFISKNKDKVLV